MTEPQNEDEPKIIVDEDWKSQVEREKEQIAQAANEPAEQEAEGQPEDFPPPSVLVFISMLGTQAMVAMGLMVDPTVGDVQPNRPLAKHCIDMLGVLQEKTQGNLTEEETNHLRDALHQLRMVYVQTAEQEAATEEPKSSIELP